MNKTLRSAVYGLGAAVVFAGALELLNLYISNEFDSQKARLKVMHTHPYTIAPGQTIEDVKGM